MNILINGYGRMGHEVESVIKTMNDSGAQIEYICCEDVQSVDIKLSANMICIDFTTPQAFKANFRFIADNFKAAVVGTTGWNDIAPQVKEYFEQKGKTLIYASNFSFGVNLMFILTRMASKLTAAAKSYDAYIMEMHHTKKLDAPSGTALSLANIVKEQYGTMPQTVSLRCSTVPGIHKVGFESSADRIELRHEAFSRQVFAKGAVEAAFMALECKGVHEFGSLLEEKFLI